MTSGPTSAPARPPRGRRFELQRDWVRQWLGALAFVAVIASARASLADHYVVPSGSMEPTVHVGDRILVNKAAFGWRLPLTEVWLGEPSLPERGSVVVLRSPEPGPVLLKRVVALPLDRVLVQHGRLSINGVEVPVSEADGERDTLVEYLGTPHRIQLALHGGPDFGPSVVPAGKILVLGDNRGNSRDGRYFGFVDAVTLRGRALGVYASDGRLTWRSL
jgi:signal peptidase I